MDQDTNETMAVDGNETTSTSDQSRRSRRQYSRACKRQMVEETLTGKESVSVIARRHDVNANQLFKWRRDYHNGLLTDAQTLVPVQVIRPLASEKNTEESKAAGQLTITLSNGHQLNVTGSVCAVTLETTLHVLSRC